MHVRLYNIDQLEATPISKCIAIVEHIRALGVCLQKNIGKKTSEFDGPLPACQRSYQ